MNEQKPCLLWYDMYLTSKRAKQEQRVQGMKNGILGYHSHYQRVQLAYPTTLLLIVLPVLMAASPAKKAMAYMMLFLRSKRPGRRIHAVHGCTMNT